MKQHKHRPLNYCICGALADEPDEQCSLHGNPYLIRCEKCGQFMKQPVEGKEGYTMDEWLEFGKKNGFMFLHTKDIHVSSQRDKPKSRCELRRKIREYLESGGLFNPEHMDHNKVRDLLIDCGDYLEKQ